jgi:hypothetical protein
LDQANLDNQIRRAESEFFFVLTPSNLLFDNEQKEEIIKRQTIKDFSYVNCLVVICIFVLIIN